MAQRVFLAVLAILASSGCPQTRVRQNYFPAFTPQPDQHEPPQDRLLLWLEGTAPGGGSYLAVDSSGAVSRWHDVRGGTRQIVGIPNLAGLRSSVSVTAPATGARYSVLALSCSDQTRCSYVLPGASLDGSPYTVLAAVRRASGRGDNYFVMTNGRGCDVALGGINCETNSALHVGWSGERTLRLGQYGNDVTFDPTPPFGAGGTVSLVEAISAPGEGKTIAILEPTINVASTVADTTPLSNSNQLFLGGTPWGVGPSQPDWHFVGDILAVLVYQKHLVGSELRLAQDYLRNRFGPR